MTSTNPAHVYEVRPSKDHRGVDLISNVLPVFRLFVRKPHRGIDPTMRLSLSFIEAGGDSWGRWGRACLPWHPSLASNHEL
jgi:hypothetical protein